MPDRPPVPEPGPESRAFRHDVVEEPTAVEVEPEPEPLSAPVEQPPERDGVEGG